MPETDPTLTAADAVTSANTVAVVVSSRAELDQVAAALALADALRQLGKEVILAAPEVPAFDLAGIDQFKTELANQSLVISFPYVESAIDKVTYDEDVEAGRFSLIIKPQKGQAPLDPNSVEYSYAGVEADIIILIGVHSWEDLDQLYVGYEDFYQRVTTIVIHTFEPELGLVKLNIGSDSCFSEGMARLLRQWGWGLTGVGATALLSGIEVATQGLQSWSVTAETFETIASLMRQGGRRVKPSARSVATVETDLAETSDSTSNSSSANPLAQAMRQRQDSAPATEVVDQTPLEAGESWSETLVEDWEVGQFEDAIDADLETELSASEEPAPAVAELKPQSPVTPTNSGKRRGNSFHHSKQQRKGDSQRNRFSGNGSANANKPGGLNYQPSGLGPGGGG